MNCTPTKTLLILAITWLASASFGFSQSVDDLKTAYSGNIEWSPSKGKLTFLTSGTIHFDKPDHKEHFWEVPAEVKEVFIPKDTVVTGAFHTFNDCYIRGEDRESSIVYGTYERDWSGPRGIQEWYYCLFQNFGGTLRVENLTALNPYAYFIRGWDTVNHVKDCNFIDQRGGNQSHSDGFSGGNGSTVDNCYFECGDDVFKVYFQNEISNCTIKMIENSVPLQLGWGNYTDGAVGNFKNLRIIGDSGRGSSGNAIISGRRGKYRIGVNVEGLVVKNPLAALVSLWEEDMQLHGTIDKANIEVDRYWDKNKGTSELIICGSREHRSTYDCNPEADLAKDELPMSPLLKKLLSIDPKKTKKNATTKACRLASQIPQLVASLHSGQTNTENWPFTNSEADVTIDRFIEDTRAASESFVQVPAYVNALWNKKRMPGETIINRATSLNEYADYLFDFLETKHGLNSELENELRCMALLAKFYSNQAEGAVFLQIFREIPIHKKDNQVTAVEYMTQASIYWRMFMQLTIEQRHVPHWMPDKSEEEWQSIHRTIRDNITTAKGAI